MLSNQIFSKSKKLVLAINFMNQIDEHKLERIVNRIIVTNLAENVEIFSEEELLHLLQLLNIKKLTKDTLMIMINSIIFIFQQAAFYNVKPAILKNNLLQLELIENLAEMFTEVWSRNSKVAIDQLKNQLIFSKQLKSVKWNSGISLSSQSSANLKHTVTHLHLNMSVENQDKDENIVLQLNHKQLLELYDNLESMQKQLDSLT